MNEEMIVKMMKNLDLTRDEAIELINEDKEIDRMTSMKSINSDLTDEQKKASKQARGVARKPSTKKSVREKKVDNDKLAIMEKISNALDNATDVNIINAEREMEFFVNGKKYKIVLSCPRK